MKKEIARTPFATYRFEDTASLLEQHWTNNDGKMSDAEYQADMQNFLKYVELYTPQKALINTVDFAYTITPEMQEWVNQNIASQANKIVKRVAFVLPSDIFSQISIQQTMEEKEAAQFGQINYFDTAEVATEWLLIER